MNSNTQELLQKLTVEEVAQALLDRADSISKLMEDGFLPPTLWKLRVLLGIIPTVDMTAYRTNSDNQIELFAIRRQTGPYAGRWCPVGGIVPKGSTIAEAMAKHWQTDIGYTLAHADWEHPLRMNQHMPPNALGELKPGVLPEPTKNSIAPFYVVQLREPFADPVFGSTAHGGQEAGGYAWFTEETLPPKDAFAYGFHNSYVQAFAWLKNKRG